MKVAYVYGPYRPRGIWKHVPILRWLIIARNIRRARKLAIRLWRLGYAVICPHSNTAFFDGQCADEVWLKGDLELLKRCNIAVGMHGWGDSEGATAEHLCCLEQHIPIYSEVRFERIPHA